MTILIQLVGERFTAAVTPPHGSMAWTTAEPMTRTELIAKLRELGCHTTDMSDAFYVADPEWLSRGD